MKKKPILIAAVSICLLMVGVTGVNALTDNLNIIHPANSSKYIENPIPMYSTNKDKSTDSFIKEKDLLKIVGEKQIKTATSYIKSNKLKTWGKHISEDDPGDTNTFNQVDNDRMVYVVTTAFPDGLDTKAGFYDNATLTSVFDAETGTLLKSKVTGDYKGNSYNR